MKKQLLAILAASLFVTLSMAQPGSLDPSFADNGKFILDNGYTDLFTDIEVQDDQKIIAVGITYDAAWVASTQVMRFLPDGTPDPTFANNGVYTFTLNFEANIYGCVIQPDHKILMTGSTTDYNDYRILMIRLNENGTLDDTFGTNGIVVQKIGPEINFFEDHSYAVALQDEKILLAGKSYNENYQFVPVVVRFTESGQLDDTFGDGGVASIPVTEVENDFDCLVVLDDGKIIAAGHYANTFLSFAMLMVRFLPDGTLDDAFGNNGIVNFPYSGVDDEAFGMAITPDDEIVIAGFTTTVGYNYSMLLLKYDMQGNPVADFGNNGVVVSDQGSYDVGNGLCIQGDGKIIVAGSSGSAPPANNDLTVWRYNPDGTLDDTFGNNGIIGYDFFANPDEALCVTRQGDGKILVAGKAHNGTNHDFIAVRLMNDYSTSVKDKALYELQISPNPALTGSTININYKWAENGPAEITFLTPSGSEVCKAEAEQGKAKITLPETLGKGIYFVRIRDRQGNQLTQKIIVE